MVRYWTCQRQAAGVKCGRVNPARLTYCQSCRKRKPKRREPAHRKALKRPYAEWVERFGERCGICGYEPTPGGRVLDRDHDHKTGAMRGLLCWRCNMRLDRAADLDWLLNAARYLDPQRIPPL